MLWDTLQSAVVKVSAAEVSVEDVTGCCCDRDARAMVAPRSVAESAMVVAVTTTRAVGSVNSDMCTVAGDPSSSVQARMTAAELLPPLGAGTDTGVDEDGGNPRLHTIRAPSLSTLTTL
jgi:hypothetical protein